MPNPFDSSRFSIIYSFTSSSGLVYSDPSLVQSAFIKSFSVVNGVPTVTINTSTFAHIGSFNGMLLQARFVGYNTAYHSDATININIVNTCNQAVIIPNTNTTLYHIAGTRQVYSILPAWTDSFNGLCGNIKFNVGNSPNFMTFNTATELFTLSAPSFLLGTNYNVVFTGNLVEPISPYNTIVSTSKTLTFIIVNLGMTYLTPATIGDISYYVGDPLLSVQLPQFTNSDSRFSVLYNLTAMYGLQIDSSII
jgi:hypothetical protein